jgi:EXPERA (EXPanded EBP superfamily)
LHRLSLSPSLSLSLSRTGTLILGRKLSGGNRWVIFYLIFDGLVHWCLEGAYIFLELTNRTQTSKSFVAEIWREYGVADARWVAQDPTLIAMEMATFVVGFFCFYLVYAIVRDLPCRHVVQISVAIAELYGGWMTFVPEWLVKSPNLNTESPIHLWLHLVFFNGLWVVIPILMLIQSCNDISRAHSALRGRQAKNQRRNEKRKTNKNKHD